MSTLLLLTSHATTTTHQPCYYYSPAVLLLLTSRATTTHQPCDVNDNMVNSLLALLRFVPFAQRYARCASGSDFKCCLNSIRMRPALASTSYRCLPDRSRHVVSAIHVGNVQDGCGQPEVSAGKRTPCFNTDR